MKGGLFMKNLLINISERKIETSNNKIKQTARNNLKVELMSALENQLKTLNCDLVQVARTSSGIGVQIDNENVGMITFEIDLKIKDLDYDLDFENSCYMETIERKEQEKAEKEKAKQEKIKADTEKRRLKAEQKAKALAEQEKTEIEIE